MRESTGETAKEVARKRGADQGAAELRRELDAALAELARERRHGERQRAEAARQRARADGFRKALKEIQRASFRGNVYHLVLESCIGLTNSARGVYVADDGRGPRVRAAIGCGSCRPNASPSPFIAALARRVLDLDDAVVCGDADTRDLPAAGPEERFASCAAVPVAVRGNLHGVVIVADKRDGAYDENDLETLLHVGDQASVAVDNARLQRELEEAYVGTVGLLADAVETKDPYTRGHCQEVSRLARLLAARLELDEGTRETICLAALLHDIGKLGVSDTILNKPGPLGPDERAQLESHVRIGSDLVGSLPALRGVAEVVLHHHERWDGTGYPARLAGDAIPVGSRIVAVVDAYCAMIDRRAYKQPYSGEQARAELRRWAGRQFDPRLVDLFMDVLDRDATTDAERYEGGCGMFPAITRRRSD